MRWKASSVRILTVPVLFSRVNCSDTEKSSAEGLVHHNRLPMQISTVSSCMLSRLK